MSTFTNRGAFSAFYDTAVAVEGTRSNGRVRGSFMACVSDEGLSDALFEGNTTNRRIITVQVRRGEDGWIGGKPQIGDIVTLECGEKFKVYSVSLPLGDDWTFQAREV